MAETTLKVGDQAPQFTAKDEQGRTVKLSDFSGKKLVLYFYPRDNTPGCTFQACNLRDNFSVLQEAGYHVLGVSTDSAQSHQRFIEKKTLPFSLLADEDKSVHQQYGTWVQKSFLGKSYWGTARMTFVIDQQGVIVQIIDRVKTRDHAAQILALDQPGT